MTDSGPKGKGTQRVSLTLNLTAEMIQALEALKAEYGVQTKARVIEMLLRDLLSVDG